MSVPITLRELGPARRLGLPDAAARAFVALEAVTGERLGPDRWRLRAKGRRVGVIQAAGVELHVRPKLKVGRLLYLASYDPNSHDGHGPARQAKSFRWLDLDVELGAADGLVPAMAKMLVKLAGRAARPGVLHGYQECDATSTVLRGRLRAADQVRQHLGLPTPLAIRYEDLTADIPENQILRAAARRLLALPGVPPWDRAHLRHLLTTFTARDLPAGTPLPRTPSTRLNARYQPALGLARLLLQGRSVDQLKGDIPATGFLFDMDKVFEAYLAGILRERLAAPGDRIETQEALALYEVGTGRVVTEPRPDIVWRRGGMALAVVDAKYKGRKLTGEADAEDGGGAGQKRLGVPAADLYQVFTYCKLLGLDHGHIVHADDRVPHRVVVEIADVKILVHRLDLDIPLPQLHAQADALALEIARGAGLTHA